MPAVIGLLLSLFATTHAQAACGYYVVAANPSQAMVDNASQMQHDAGMRSDKPRCPCEGPECRARESSSTTSATPPPSSDQQSLFVCQIATHAPPALTVGLTATEPSGVVEVYLPFSDPPPRPLSSNSF